MPTVHRFFFALQPTGRDRLLIAVHRDALAAAQSPVANDRLHLTMGVTADFASYPSAVERRLKAIGDAVGEAPVPVVLDRLAASRRSYALRPSRSCARIKALHAALAAPMRQGGLLRSDWKFSPHVTLAYRAGEPFSTPIDAIAWESRDFVLIYSAVGETRHVELGRWPLVPRQGELFH